MLWNVYNALRIIQCILNKNGKQRIIHMNYRVEGSSVIMERPEDFDAEKIFECGQCFRWNLQEDGYWTGVALGHVLKLREEGDTVRFLCSEDDFLKVWMPYFDLGRDYTAVRARISIDPFTAKAAEFGKGIRILQQDAWETLCSFIVSQCNNIKRIKGIVERLCVLFGDQITYHGEVHYLFPPPERLAHLEEKDLESLRAGYRTGYILNAAREIVQGRLSLDILKNVTTDKAIEALTELRGVGIKVANCAVLFGLGKIDAFPVDVWVRRAIERHYDAETFDSTVFGEDAGIAQQYIFYYIRNGQD